MTPANGASLDDDQRAIVDLVAATTAGNHRSATRQAVTASLTAGRRPDHVLEVLLHLVPFVGFARVLAGVAVARDVFTERGEHGELVHSPAPVDRYGRGRDLLREIAGPAAEAVLTSLEDVAPDMARILVELTYGDIYSRPELGVRVRLLATITALVALGDTAVLLRAQARAGLSQGWRSEQLDEVVTRVETLVGPEVVGDARSVLADAS